MLRFLIRSIGVVIFAGAFVAAVADGTRSIVGHELSWTSTAQAIGLFWPNAVGRWQEAVGSLWPPLWDPVLVWILAQPAALVFGVAGLLLMALGRARPRVIRLSRA